MYPEGPTTYPQGPGYPPRKPPASAADVTISIVALVVTVLVGAASAFFGFFSLAFLDYCPPESCSVEGAVSAVMTALAIAAGAGIIGSVATIVQLVRHKLAWPFAVGTLVLCAGIIAVGAVGFVAAVGG